MPGHRSSFALRPRIGQDHGADPGQRWERDHEEGPMGGPVPVARNAHGDRGITTRSRNDTAHRLCRQGRPLRDRPLRSRSLTLDSHQSS